MMEITDAMKERLAKAKAAIDKGYKESTDELVAQMTATRDEFLQELEALSPAQWGFKPDEKAWSITEVCRHVSNTIRAIGNLVPGMVAGTISIRPEDAKIAAMDDDPGDFDTLKEMVRSAFDAAIDGTPACDAMQEDPLTMPHPFFGPLNPKEWASFNLMHAQIHVKQVQRNKGCENFPG